MAILTYTADTYIVSADATTNFSGSNPLVFQWLDPSITRLLGSANIGDFLPEVSSAILTLTNASLSSSGQPGLVSILQYGLSAINLGVATWDNWNTGTPWPTAGGGWDDRNTSVTPVVFSPPVGAVGTQVNINITTMWNQAVSEGYYHFPLIIRFQSESGAGRTSYIQGNGDTTPMFITYTPVDLPPGLGGHFAGNFQDLKGRIDG